MIWNQLTGSLCHAPEDDDDNFDLKAVRLVGLVILEDLDGGGVVEGAALLQVLDFARLQVKVHAHVHPARLSGEEIILTLTSMISISVSILNRDRSRLRLKYLEFDISNYIDQYQLNRINSALN